MEAVQEDIVIVGGGIAGLTTSLGLHRYPFSLCFHAYVLHVSIYICEGLQLQFKIVKNANIYVVGWVFEA
jgi:thioredoxin reductase